MPFGDTPGGAGIDIEMLATQTRKGGFDLTHYWLNTAGLGSAGEFLIDHQVKPAELTARLGWSPSLLLACRSWMERDACLRLGAEIARTAEDPYAGVKLGARLQLTDYTLWGRRVVSSRTLGEAIRAAQANIHLIARGSRLLTILRGDELRLVPLFDGPLGVTTDQHDQANLSIVRSILNLGIQDVPVRVEVPARLVHGDKGEKLARVLRASFVQTDGPPALVVPREVLTQRLAQCSPNPPPCSRHRNAADTGRAVMLELLREARPRRPTLAAVAHRFDMNPRTLQRHLSAWGISFGDLVDELCQRQAIAMLTDTDLSVTDIGLQLGYSDTAHLTRAVRRWTGRTPSQIRRGVTDLAAVDTLDVAANDG